MPTCPIDDVKLVGRDNLFYCPKCRRFWTFSHPDGSPLNPLEYPERHFPLQMVVIPDITDTDTLGEDLP
jgi:hypothetical protein